MSEFMLNFVNETYSFRGKIDDNFDENVWFEITVEIEVENKRIKITNATEEN